MKIPDRQQIIFPFQYPSLFVYSLARWTMPVATGVVMHLKLPAQQTLLPVFPGLFCTALHNVINNPRTAVLAKSLGFIDDQGD